jgi:hypothetical protein
MLNPSPTPQPDFTTYAPALAQRHADYLAARGVSPEVAAARGYRSIGAGEAIRELGYGKATPTPGLLMPLYGVLGGGELTGWQYRPDEPRETNGRTLKFESPAKQPGVLDVNPAMRERVGAGNAQLFLVEGLTRADALAGLGIPALAVLGVYGWRGRNAQNGVTALPDFEAVALRGARVILAFDGDSSTNASVWDGLNRLRRFLIAKGAEGVGVLTVPQDYGEKAGLDDAIATMLAEGMDGEAIMGEMAGWVSAEMPPRPLRSRIADNETAVPGWSNEPSGLARQGHDGPVVVVPHRIRLLGRVLVDGEPEGVSARVEAPGAPARVAWLPATAVVSTRPAEVLRDATGIAWRPKRAAEVADWLGDALTVSEAPSLQGIRSASWDGGRLLVPGDELVLVDGAASALHPYAQTEGDDAEAREVWTWLLGLALEHPKWGALLGMALASPAVGFTPVGTSITHVWGDSRQGKTLAVAAAMASQGRPGGIMASWFTTVNALGARMEALNVLAAAIDDTSNGGAQRDEQLAAAVMAVANGVGKSRATQTGGLREQRHWALNVLSSGERRLTTVSALGGVKARVLELEGPVFGQPGDAVAARMADAVLERATSAHGWPLRWFADATAEGTVSPETLRAMYSEAEAALVHGVAPGIAPTLARRVGVAAVGLTILGDLLGFVDSTASGWAGVLFPVRDEVVAALAASGADAGQRLEDAVREALAARAWAFPLHLDRMPEGRTREGATYGDGRLAVFPQALKAIAHGIGLADYMPAVTGLMRAGRILPGSDGKPSTVVKLEGRPVRAYIFAPLEADDAEM